MISGAAALTHLKGISHGPKNRGLSNLHRARHGRCALELR
jgi:hypothetical protein